jgi:nucleoside-diphosphate-sugar epimerase
MKIEKVLVTGGAGYVGSVLIPMLLDAGYKVRVVDNLMYGNPHLLSYVINPGFEFIRGDLTNEQVTQKSLEGVDAVIHLAAIVGYPACLRSPELAQAVNVGVTRNLYKLRDPDQAIIFASTGSNYGKVDGICTEKTPLNPLSEYGRTKTTAECDLLQAGNVVLYRFATAFGISPRMRLDLMINDFVFQAIRNKQLIVYEKHVKRTFIHVSDMGRAFIFALQHLRKMRDEVYNVGNEKMNFTKDDVARLIRKKIDYYLHYAEIGEDMDKRDYEVSYSKIRKLGFTTQISIDQGLDELIKGMAMVKMVNPYTNLI